MSREHQDLLDAVRIALPSTTALSRAELLDEITMAVYDWVKANVSTGARPGAFDDRDTPEREALALLVDGTTNYRDELSIGLGEVRNDASMPPADSPRIVRLAHEVVLAERAANPRHRGEAQAR